MDLIKKNISNEAKEALIKKFGEDWKDIMVKQCYEVSYPSVYFGVVFYNPQKDRITVTSCHVNTFTDGSEQEEGDVLIAIPPSTLEYFVDEDTNTLTMDSKKAEMFFTKEELKTINNLKELTFENIFKALDLTIKDMSNKWINYYQGLFLDENYA